MVGVCILLAKGLDAFAVSSPVGIPHPRSRSNMNHILTGIDQELNIIHKPKTERPKFCMQIISLLLDERAAALVAEDFR